MPLQILLTSGVQLLFYLMTLVFVLYSLFLAYHWFTYGSSKSVASISLAIYLMVSAPLFLTMALIAVSI